MMEIKIVFKGDGIRDSSGNYTTELCFDNVTAVSINNGKYNRVKICIDQRNPETTERMEYGYYFSTIASIELIDRKEEIEHD